MLSRVKRRTILDVIYDGDPLILEEVHRLPFIAITYIPQVESRTKASSVYIFCFHTTRKAPIMT